MASLQSILAIKAFQMTTKQIKEFCDCVEKKMNQTQEQTPPTDNSAPIGDPDVENK
jgi:hypothetical protein